MIEQMAQNRISGSVGRKKKLHTGILSEVRVCETVMMNILSNAVKYNRENGHDLYQLQGNSIRTARNDDNGICLPGYRNRNDRGVPETIFEPFAQEHAGSRTKFAGTGLGMPITKKLVEKMGGTITFESEEGTGTTFVIRVPFEIDQECG